MRKVLAALLFSVGLTIVAFAQPKADSSTTDERTFYFPAKLFKDSVAFEQAIPPLSKDFIGVYKQPKKKQYFETMANAYFAAGNYATAIEMMDSVEKITDDKTFSIYMRPYAVAKTSNVPVSAFDDKYRNEFRSLFDKLSFRKRVYASADSNALKYTRKDYQDFKGTLEKKNKDSLNMEDVKALLEKYTNVVLFNKAFESASSIIGDPKYQSMHPFIKAGAWSGVVPVEVIDDAIDPHMQYKLLMELTGFALKDQPDSEAKKEINPGLIEVARKMNLHGAAGVPKKNIHLVIVVHAAALNAFLNNYRYKVKYGIDNPNIPMIKELQDFGATIIVCGQAMTFVNLEMEDLVPGIKQAFSAQTVLSTYQLKGYVYYNVRLD